MGMFDTFVGTVKCPKCGKDIDIEFQTKNYECLLRTYDIGSYVDKANENYFYMLKDWDGFPVCDNCKEEVPVYAAIRNGRLVSYITGVEDIDDLDIMDIEDDPKITEVINLIKKRIENWEDTYHYDANVYFDKNSEYAFKDKCYTVIDELKSLLEDVRRL